MRNGTRRVGVAAARGTVAGPTRSPVPPGWWAELADLVWPGHCPGCGASGPGAAPACATCLRCFATAPAPTVPAPRPAWLPQLWAVTDYEGRARAVLLAYKEHGVRRLAGPLGTALAAGLAAASSGSSGSSDSPGSPGSHCVVVPMPSSAAARRSRGEDPTLRLARVAAGVLRSGGRPARLLPALEQSPGVRDQAGLSASDRVRNLSGGLRIRPSAIRWLRASPTVLLADDIVTTGATLAEATRVLQAGDIAVAGAAVVAATRRQTGPSGRAA